MEQKMLIRQKKDEKKKFMNWKNYITPILDKLSPEIKYESILKQTIYDFIEIMGRKVN